MPYANDFTNKNGVQKQQKDKAGTRKSKFDNLFFSKQQRLYDRSNAKTPKLEGLTGRSLASNTTFKQQKATQLKAKNEIRNDTGTYSDAIDSANEDSI